MKIKCPICNQELIKIDNMYRCENRHNYDIAKEGYVNLLKKQGGKEFGDSNQMILARRHFFEKDYYAPLKEELTNIIQSYHPTTMIDLGSGEGYYTNYFEQNIHCDIAGIDISKEGVKIASKKNKNVFYAVASIQDIPLFDSECDLVINSFTPLDLNEIDRILKKDGILITTKVSKKHLIELKEAIYDEVYLNDNEPFIDERFKLIESKINEFQILLDNNEDITNLFMMTPYANHTSLTSKEKLKQLQSLKITCQFDIDIYRKL